MADLPAGWTDSGAKVDLNTVWPDDKTVGPCAGAADLTSHRSAFSASAFVSEQVGVIGSYVTQYRSDADSALYLVRFSSPKFDSCNETQLHSEISNTSSITTTVVLGSSAGGPSSEAAKVVSVVNSTTDGIALTSTITQVYLKAARTVGWLQFVESSMTPIDPALQQKLISLFATRLATL
jgi:hypothetical protein